MRLANTGESPTRLRVPEQGLLYSFSWGGSHFLFNGENLALVHVPGHLPALLKQHTGKPVVDLLDYVTSTADAVNGAAIERLVGSHFFLPLDNHKLLRREQKRVSAIENNKRLSNIHLQISSGCNLACRYCYADGGAFKNTQPHGMLSVEKAARFITFYLDRAEDTCFLDLLGGEPLLNQHLPEIIDLFLAEAAARNKHLRIQITTNGTRLTTRWAEFLASRKIRVAVSLDGWANIHDGARPKRNGGASFAESFAGLKHMVEVDRNRVSVRMTCGHHNVHHILEFYDAICRNMGEIPFDLSPVIAEPDHALALRKDEFKTYENMLARVEQRKVDRHTHDCEAFVQEFATSELSRREAKLFNCHPGFNVLAVTIKGDLYPCVSLMERPEWRMGNISDGNWSFSPDLQGILLNRGVLQRRKCHSCWAKYLCSGGCLSVNLVNGGNAHEPSPYICSMYRSLQASKLKGYAMGWLMLKSRSVNTDGIG